MKRSLQNWRFLFRFCSCQCSAVNVIIASGFITGHQCRCCFCWRFHMDGWLVAFYDIRVNQNDSYIFFSSRRFIWLFSRCWFRMNPPTLPLKEKQYLHPSMHDNFHFASFRVSLDFQNATSKFWRLSQNSDGVCIPLFSEGAKFKVSGSWHGPIQWHVRIPTLHSGRLGVP